jgi:hypothetical protein
MLTISDGLQLCVVLLYVDWKAPLSGKKSAVATTVTVLAGLLTIGFIEDLTSQNVMFSRIWWKIKNS